MSAGFEQTEPATPAPPAPPSEPAAMPSMAAFGSNETCPSCGARMAADQRYCLNCGHRRGEPRLPFMDAVTFMESMNAPAGGAGAPPPPPAAAPNGPERWNTNVVLVAVVAVLVLALGVGFLIGRVGHNDNSTAGGGVRIVQLGGDGTAEAAPEETTPEATKNSTSSTESAGKGKAKSPAKKSTSEKTKIKEGSKEEEELQRKASEEVTHAKVPQAKPTATVGETCEPGTAGCGPNHKFEGNFFGE